MYPTSGYLFKDKNTLKTYIHFYVHHSIIYSNQDTETILVPSKDDG